MVDMSNAPHFEGYQKSMAFLASSIWEAQKMTFLYLHLYLLFLQFIALHTSPLPVQLRCCRLLGDFHIKQAGGVGISHLAQNDPMNHLCFS